MEYFKNINKEGSEGQDFNFDYIPEIKIVYTPNIPLSSRPKIHSSEQAVAAFLHTYDSNTIQLFESFKVMLLNPSNRILGIYSVSQGVIDNVQVKPRLLFGTALKAGATAMIISHSHPTEEVYPSKSDVKSTKEIKFISGLLGISLIDHIILSSEAHFSFRENKLL